jgi:hypothetical protein
MYHELGTFFVTKRYILLSIDYLSMQKKGWFKWVVEGVETYANDWMVIHHGKE